MKSFIKKVSRLFKDMFENGVDIDVIVNTTAKIDGAVSELLQVGIRGMSTPVIEERSVFCLPLLDVRSRDTRNVVVRTACEMLGVQSNTPGIYKMIEEIFVGFYLSDKGIHLTHPINGRASYVMLNMPQTLTGLAAHPAHFIDDLMTGTDRVSFLVDTEDEGVLLMPVTDSLDFLKYLLDPSGASVLNSGEQSPEGEDPDADEGNEETIIPGHSANGVGTEEDVKSNDAPDGVSEVSADSQESVS